MNFGVVLPTIGPSISPDAQRRLLTTAADVGFDSAWVGDHVALPADVPAEYPFSKDGKPPEIIDISSDLYESLTTLSHLSAVTERLSFGTYACIAPLRNPVVLTKQVLTLQAVSDGRFHFGVTPGWLRTEYESVGVPYEERGTRTDEFLEMFRRACEEGAFAFEGTHHSFPETGFFPQPDERPPVWIAGVSGASFRRLAEYGDGWLTMWDRPSDIAAQRKRIMNAWTDYDRDGDPRIALYRPMRPTDEDSDRPLIGTPRSIADDIRAYADAGVTHIVVTPFVNNLDEQVAELEMFGSEVLSLV